MVQALVTSAAGTGINYVFAKLFGGSKKPPSDDAARNATIQAEIADAFAYGIQQVQDLNVPEASGGIDYNYQFKTRLIDAAGRYASLPVYTPAEYNDSINVINGLITAYNNKVSSLMSIAGTTSPVATNVVASGNGGGNDILSILFNRASSTLSNFMDLWSKKEISSINEDATNAAIAEAEANKSAKSYMASVNWPLVILLIVGAVFLIRRFK